MSAGSSPLGNFGGGTCGCAVVTGLAPDRQIDGFGAALGRLRSAQKSAKGAPIYSLYVNRPLGRILAAAAFQVRLNPDQVTYISAAFTFVGIAVIALGPATVPAGLLVSVLLVLGYALDAADGQLARLRGGGSLLGEWLDHMIDSAKIACLHLAVLVCFWRTYDLGAAWLVVPMIFCAVSCVHFFGMILVDLLGRVERAKTGSPTPALPASLWKTALKMPMDYGVLCLAFALLGWHGAFFAVYTFLALGSTGYLLLVVRKWRRDIVALSGL
jgi:phosphatidylglycerophosphate synthase